MPCSTSCRSRASSTTCRRIALLFKQRLAEIKDRHPTVIAEVRGEGLLIGLRAVVPNGDLVDALRAEKLLTVAAGDNVVRLRAAADHRRGGNRRGDCAARSRLRRDRKAQAAGRAQARERRVNANGIRHFLDLIDIPRANCAG